MDFPLRPCRILNRDFCMAQMDYSLACLRLSLLCFVGLLIPYFIKGFISWSNHMTWSYTKMFLTTLRATMIPQTPIPASNPILASMPNIYLNYRNTLVIFPQKANVLIFFRRGNMITANSLNRKYL